MKAFYLHGKTRKFIPDSFHHLSLPKPADDVLKKIKYHRRNTINKRLEALNWDKEDTSCCVVIGMEDEDENHYVDGNNVIKDFVAAPDSVDAYFYDADKERE